MCKKIYRGGGAEKSHAEKKYKEAVAAAVEACADDVKGLARRVLGGAHPTTEGIEDDLRNARVALRARETPS